MGKGLSGEDGRMEASQDGVGKADRMERQRFVVDIHTDDNLLSTAHFLANTLHNCFGEDFTIYTSTGHKAHLDFRGHGGVKVDLSGEL